MTVSRLVFVCVGLVLRGLEFMSLEESLWGWKGEGVEMVNISYVLV